MNHTLLQTELAKDAYANLSATDAATLLNTLTIPKWREPAKAEVENFYRNSGFSQKLTTFLTKTDSQVARGVVNFDIPDYADLLRLYVGGKEVKGFFSGSIPSVNGQNAEIGAVIAGLVQASSLTGFTQQDADGFFNFFKYLISRAQELLGEAVTESDIFIARNTGKINTARQQVAHWQSILSDLESGVPREFDVPEVGA